MFYVEGNSFKTIKMLFQHSRKKMTLCKGLTHDFGQKLAFSFKVFLKDQDIYYVKINFARHEHDTERTANKAGL